MTEELKIASLETSCHIMVDIETLGFDCNSHPIIAVGAMTFNPYLNDDEVSDITQYLQMDFINTEMVFFARLNFSSPYSRPLDFDTLNWWIQKPEQAVMLARWMSACKNDQEHHNRLRFEQFMEWVGKARRERFVYLWAHGNTFDIPFLKSYAEEYDVKWPFSYKGLNETRTMITAYEFNTGRRFEWPEKIAAHHPLGDVMNQIRVVKKVVNELRYAQQS